MYINRYQAITKFLILAKTKKKKQDEEVEEDESDKEDFELKNKVKPELSDNKEHIDDKDENGTVESVSKTIEELTVEDIKVDDSKKLTHKEKKKLKKQQEYEKQMETLLKKGGQGHSELETNFTVSQTQKSAGQMAALENAVDIKVENFSISAKGKDLFVNANLLIANGRHYGLVGPNGLIFVYNLYKLLSKNIFF